MSSPLNDAIKAELHTLGVVTVTQVHDFRVPGERRGASNMNTLINYVQSNRGLQWVSRKHIRHVALGFLRTGQLT